jgi:hypothetical protein
LSRIITIVHFILKFILFSAASQHWLRQAHFARIYDNSRIVSVANLPEGQCHEVAEIYLVKCQQKQKEKQKVKVLKEICNFYCFILSYKNK